ncbi:hypothetical protein SAMN05421736_13028 [Evansella caseinilytica]|uniref:Uncharacterized protein n=1 Tax=Evansella caseinilytica TaxID=1503961 RepID=A0A1H3UYY5_9BACI|nr:hypothetical protein [Evansella caseinilytica]SDZ67652.1 hypothetical protein SAMN05421736_13028 [Evansella caseinilytica]
MIFLLLVFFAIVVWLEVPGLIRKKYWRELAVFSLFLLSTFFLSLLQLLDVRIPNPVKGIEYVIKDILRLNYK